MITMQDLISKEYRNANRALHEGKGGFGGSGYKHAENVRAYLKELGKCKTILDYGCGEGTLRDELNKIPFKEKMYEYDPGVSLKSTLPKPAGLVVCTDVLEHVEPDKLDTVLRHLYDLTLRGCYLVVATRPANKLMPDGSNAHRIIEDTPWWLERVARMPWTILRHEDRRKAGGTMPHEVRIWLKK